MNFEGFKSKLPIALTAVIISVSAILLISFISEIEFREPAGIIHHQTQTLPLIVWLWGKLFPFDSVLPILTTVVGVCFVTGKGLKQLVLTWAICCLLVLHVLCFSFFSLAFYLSQKFVVHLR